MVGGPGPGRGSGRRSRRLGRQIGIARLGHLFPSLLNAAATLAIAGLAGAPAAVALGLAASMLLVQVSIGAANDLADADRDAISKPGKPLPSGAATAADALALAVAGAGGGLGLSALVSIPAALVAAAGLALGYVYDLRLSRTAWSWLPLALALPLVPVHAWLGATGGIPMGLLALLPAGALAGAALAMANGLVDIERDRVSGRGGTVAALGVKRSWILHALLLLGLFGVALLLAPGVPTGSPPADDAGAFEALRAVRAWVLPAGLVAIVLGAAALRAAAPATRERGWEVEAVGVAGVGIGWLAGTALQGE